MQGQGPAARLQVECVCSWKTASSRKLNLEEAAASAIRTAHVKSIRREGGRSCQEVGRVTWYCIDGVRHPDQLPQNPEPGNYARCITTYTGGDRPHMHVQLRARVRCADR